MGATLSTENLLNSCAGVMSSCCFGFKNCSWVQRKAFCEDSKSFTWHWEMEKVLYCHLRDDHKNTDMATIAEHEKATGEELWDNEEAIDEALLHNALNETPCRIPKRHMRALAYYIAAVCVKEQEHIPIIGPSLDRRMLVLLSRLCNSDTVHSLVCFSCAQVHVCVKSWTYNCQPNRPTWKLPTTSNVIQYHTVEESLLKMRKNHANAFAISFELSKFRERFASDVHMDGILSPCGHGSFYGLPNRF